MTARPVVEFFYSACCPSSCLAFARLQEVATRTGAGVVPRPVVAGWLPVAAGAAQRERATDDAEARYARKDLADWARFCGVPLRLPQPLDMDAEWVQRGAVVALGAARGRAWMEAAFEARFGLGLDLSQRESVLALADRIGLGGASFREALDAAQTRAVLTTNGDELLRRGGFATPSLFLGEEMFFGHASVSLLEWAVMRSSERPFIAPGEHGR
jgi:2-hydroxychromene-2-carboxylate isomerase